MTEPVLLEDLSEDVLRLRLDRSNRHPVFTGRAQ